MKLQFINGVYALVPEYKIGTLAWLYFSQTVYNIFITARPHQWLKNVLVFAGLFFAQDIFDWQRVNMALAAFIAFCFISSAVYMVNDIVDRRKDSLHPVKKFRPLASGALDVETAITSSLIFAGTALWLAWQIDPGFFLVVMGYLGLNIAYSLRLKNIVILDVLIIAAGFMLRIIGGTLAISEPVSSWLIITATFLTLFLALGKRRSELLNLGKNAAQTRSSLAEYTLPFINQAITIVVTGCLMSYALYTLDAATVSKFGNAQLVYTMPFVIYGLFRYLFLVNVKEDGEAPELIILHDKPLLFCIAAYLLTVLLLVYF